MDELELTETEDKQPGDDATNDFDGVVVAVQRNPDGSFGTQVFVNGDVRPTEVETILGAALKEWRTRLGLAK